MHAEKEMTAKEKQRLIYEEYQRKRKMELAEEKVRQENMMREMQAHKELLALRIGLAIPKSSQPEQAPAVQNSQIERGTDGNDVVRIQLTKLDGSKMLMSTSAKKTISELWDEIEDKYKDVDRSQCHLVQRFPRKVFAEESMSSSLQSLGLTPTANLGFEKSGREAFKASADDSETCIRIFSKNKMFLAVSIDKTKTYSELWDALEERNENLSRTYHCLTERKGGKVYEDEIFESTLESLGLFPSYDLDITFKKRAPVHCDCEGH